MNPSRITPTIPGKYLVTANVQWQQNTGGLRAAGIRRNGSNLLLSNIITPTSQGDAYHSLSLVTLLNGRGDYLEVVVTHTASSALYIIGTNNDGACDFTVSWIGQ